MRKDHNIPPKANRQKLNVKTCPQCFADPNVCQRLSKDSFDTEGRQDLPDDVGNLINDARQSLHAAMDAWQLLHDPEPEQPDQNFKHNGKEYNYRAAETFRITEWLGQGKPTDYALPQNDLREQKGGEMDEADHLTNHIAKAKNWLQARFLESSQSRDIVQVYTPEGPREATEDETFRALIPQQVFHDFLLSIDAPVLNITRECERLGWIFTTQRHQVVGGRTVPVGDRYYSIGPQVITIQSEETRVATFDTFLSHNRHDKPAVRDLKQRLVTYQLTVWFDEDELQPGIPWPRLLEDGIKHSKSIAVLVGKDGLGPWEDEEMQVALRLAVKDKRPVIPVLMPGAPAQPQLPMFLDNRTWVDVRAGLTSDALDRLVWGITGKKPNP